MEEKTDAVKEYVAWRGLPRDLSLRVKKHYSFYYTRRAAFDEVELLGGLSPSLRSEVRAAHAPRPRAVCIDDGGKCPRSVRSPRDLAHGSLPSRAQWLVPPPHLQLAHHSSLLPLLRPPPLSPLSPPPPHRRPTIRAHRLARRCAPPRRVRCTRGARR